jgi:putative transposase
VLLRLAYLALTNTFTLMRLLPMSDQEKDIEILALRHQLIVLQRQVGKPAFTQTDRVVLAGLLCHLRWGSCASSCCWYARTRCCAGTAT